MNPIFAHLTARPWAMERRSLDALAQQLSTASLEASQEQLEAREARRERAGDWQPTYTVAGGVAVIPIAGTILSSVPWYYEYLDIPATGTTDVARNLHAALGDRSVDAILFAVNSPGGTVDGVQELADLIHASRDTKPTAAHIDSLGASAAMWLAAQAGRITANRTAEVGSIGVYTVLIDRSEMAGQLGLKVHVVSSGPLKGAGVPGSEITDPQLAAEQEIIDDLAAEFVSAVARGRGRPVDQIKALATGGTWIAPKAVANGLIDAVATMAEASAALTSHVTPTSTTATANTPNRKGTPMSKDTTVTPDPQQPEPKAKSAAEIAADTMKRLGALEAAFPDHPAFARKQWENGASVEDATIAHYQVVKAENADLKVKLEAAEARAAKAEKDLAEADTETAETLGNLGTQPVQGKGGKATPPAGGDAVAAYEAKVKALADAGDLRPEYTIADKHPDLHAAYIEAVNA